VLALLDHGNAARTGNRITDDHANDRTIALAFDGNIGNLGRTRDLVTDP